MAKCVAATSPRRVDPELLSSLDVVWRRFWDTLCTVPRLFFSPLHSTLSPMGPFPHLKRTPVPHPIWQFILPPLFVHFECESLALDRSWAVWDTQIDRPDWPRRRRDNSNSPMCECSVPTDCQWPKRNQRI